MRHKDINQRSQTGRAVRQMNNDDESAGLLIPRLKQGREIISTLAVFTATPPSGAADQHI